MAWALIQAPCETGKGLLRNAVSLSSPGRRRAQITLTLLLGLVLFGASAPSSPVGYAASPRGSPITAQAFPRNDRYGIAHISYGNGSFSPERYEFARSAGVGWNRWAFYWNEIERAPEAFDYSTQDATVAADRAQGLRILGVILGTPAWAAEGARVTGLPQPQVGQRGYSEVGRIQAHGATGPNTTTMPPRGLERAVFSDGTDTPGPGKTINADNPWARFVYQTAKRYRGKVHAWEIWNEPDFTPNASTDWFGFWDGTIEDYARLLKVGYLAVKAADPDAIVVMAGLAYWFQPDFFPRLLAALKKDPTGAAHGYYFDVTAWHLYSRASQLLHRTQWVEDQLVRVGIRQETPSGSQKQPCRSVATLRFRRRLAVRRGPIPGPSSTRPPSCCRRSRMPTQLVWRRFLSFSCTTTPWGQGSTMAWFGMMGRLAPRSRPCAWPPLI